MSPSSEQILAALVMAALLKLNCLLCVEVVGCSAGKNLLYQEKEISY